MDVLLVGFIAGFIYGGWRTGLVRRLLGLLFLFISAVASAYFRYPVGAIAQKFFPNIPSDYANLVGYTIAFPVILIGLHVAAHFLVGKVHPSGLSKFADSALGALFGGIEAILIISVVIVIVDTYFGTASTLAKDMPPGYLSRFTEAFNSSETVKLLRDTTVPLVLTIVSPFLPKDLTSIFPGGLPGRLPFPTK